MQIKQGLPCSHLRGPLPARPYRAQLCCPQHWPRTGPAPAAQRPRLCTPPEAYGQAACLPRGDPLCTGAAAIPAVQQLIVSLKAGRCSLHACCPLAACSSMLPLQPECRTDKLSFGKQLPYMQGASTSSQSGAPPQHQRPETDKVPPAAAGEMPQSAAQSPAWGLRLGQSRLWSRLRHSSW